MASSLNKTLPSRSFLQLLTVNYFTSGCYASNTTSQAYPWRDIFTSDRFFNSQVKHKKSFLHSECCGGYNILFKLMAKRSEYHTGDIYEVKKIVFNWVSYFTSLSLSLFSLSSWCDHEMKCYGVDGKECKRSFFLTQTGICGNQNETTKKNYLKRMMPHV